MAPGKHGWSMAPGIIDPDARRLAPESFRRGFWFGAAWALSMVGVGLVVGIGFAIWMR